MTQADIITVQKSRVYCEGGPTASLGHPRIYLNLGADKGKNAQAICPYCGRMFRFSKTTSQAAQSA